MAFQKYQKDFDPALRRALERITGDHRSGATAIALNTLRLAVRTTRVYQSQTSVQQRRIIKAVFDEIIQAHPQMGILYTLRLRLQKQRLIDSRGLREFAGQIKADLEAQQFANAQAFAKQVGRRARVVTTSYSSAVARALVESRPKKIKVVVSESRPIGEGRRLACFLTEAKIPVTLVVDDALGLFIPGAGAVVLGTDAVTPQYFINKIGSYALCLLAREHKVPVILLTDTFRLVGKSTIPQKQIVHSAQEVVRQPQPYPIDNRYFDFIPLKLVDRIICNGQTLVPRKLFKPGSRH